ncbi:hypothetical protein FPV67DRAFT_1673601 [Lyophyllum atratum]|nr:hypothetical protein FPV67DRAFT_1673601 [Lyophyllum atratum]
MSLTPAIQHVRVNNPNFAAYPWTTNDICRVNDLPALLGRDSPTYLDLQVLASKLMELEMKNTPVIKEDQYSLFVEQMHGRPVTCATAGQAMESLYATLMAYRLIDLDLSTRGSHPRILSSSPSLPLVTKRTKVPFEDLNDLKKIIGRSNKDLQHRDKELVKRKNPLDPTPSSSALSSSNPLMSLYTHFAKSVQRHRLTNTIINLSAAALHLAYLLRGNVYLPTETSEIEEFLISSSDDREQMDRIRTEYGTASQGCVPVMQRTLFLALTVSPVMLLMPRSYEQFAGKAALLETWSQFGSIVRPSSIVSADTAVWKVLFSATKGGDILADLKVALSELEPALGPHSSPWFAVTPHKPVPHASTSQTSMVVELGSESDDGPDVGIGPSDESHYSALGTKPVSSQTVSVQTSALTSSPANITPTNDSAIDPPSCDQALIPPLLRGSEGSQEFQDPVTVPDGFTTPRLAGSDPDGHMMSDRTDLQSPAPSPHSASEPLTAIAQHELRGVSPNSPLHADNTTVVTVSGGGPPPTPASQSRDADTGCIDPADLQTRSPSPVMAPKAPLKFERPVTRSSAANNPSVTKPPSSSGQKKTLKRPTTTSTPKMPSQSGRKNSHKRPTKKVKKEATTTVPDVPGEPIFIDLTLEGSDNDLPDPPIEVNSETGFVTGALDVTYPLAGSGVPYTWKPRFHFGTELEWFYKLDSAVQRSASRPAPIKHLTHSEYSALAPSTLLDMLKTYACILVVDEPHTDVGFTRDVFNNFCRLDEATTIQDFSVPDGPTYRKGSVLDLLEASRLPNPPALSALHLPSAYDMYPNLPFSSDWAVWQQVQGEAYCRFTDLYPIPHLRWGIASTGSAYHYWHYDANGLMTFIKLKCGRKLWYIAVPKDGDFTIFMQPDIMTKFELNESNQDLWDVYVVVLHPGTTLIMRPTLPHCVVTPEPSFCSGGHFIAVSTIPYTIVGAYNHSIGASSYTNTDHFNASHSALMRLLVFYQLKLFADPPEPSPHMPDLSTWDGFLVVIYLCIYFEIVSALISHRVGLHRRLFSRYTYVGPEGSLTGMDVFYKIFSVFLAHHARLLVRYKHLAVQRKVEGINGRTTVADVSSDVYRCIRGGPAWLFYSDSAAVDGPASFAWHGPVYDIQLNSKQQEYVFPYASGYVYGDIDMARSLGFKISPEDVFFLSADHELSVDGDGEGDDTDDDNDGDDNELSDDDGEHSDVASDGENSDMGYPDRRVTSLKRARSTSGSQDDLAPKKARQVQ